MNVLCKLCLALVLVAVPTMSPAAEWVDAHVTSLSGTFVGNTSGQVVLFTIDRTTSGCIAGLNWLVWQPTAFTGTNASDVLQKQLAQTRAVFSNLQLAYAMGKIIRLYVYDAGTDGMCAASTWMVVVN